MKQELCSYFAFIILAIILSSLMINDVRSEELDGGYKMVLSFNDFLIIGVTVAVVFVLFAAPLNFIKRNDY